MRALSTPPPAPVSAQHAVQVLPPGPPAGCATPLPVGPVVESVADQLRALHLPNSFMDSPWFGALRSRLLLPQCLSLLSPSSPPTGLLHKNWRISVSDKKSCRLSFPNKDSKLRKKDALERMQADLVGLVGEASDLDEEILELWRIVSVVPEPEDMDASDGSTSRPVSRKRSKARATRGKKVKILSDSSTKILKLAQGLSHGDLLKLAKRLEMALDSGSNAASSKDIDTNVQNLDDEEDVELSMTYG